MSNGPKEQRFIAKLKIDGSSFEISASACAEQEVLADQIDLKHTVVSYPPYTSLLTLW